MVITLNQYGIPTSAFDCGPRVGRVSSALLHVYHPPNVPEVMAFSTTRTVTDRAASPLWSSWPTRLLIALLCYGIPTSAFDCGPRVERISIAMRHVYHPPSGLKEMAYSNTRTVANRVSSIAFPRRLHPAGRRDLAPQPSLLVSRCPFSMVVRDKDVPASVSKR
ncbi:uncharacterized protein LOC119464200 isoform X2 [Dermacentor silvarum]|uniref:uncharacterized protein LOC119464200 isoform X2 n=1 Tax=Dermacentor silvarum TaxID=543639 RepID=UPI002100B247|nr:uncharacterized protein LOC119464200 isoform X2 [Dermacentor silvarum]XP_049511958.1 uncharacterized protein LOC119464200 isoform X2 [Dermacentor silvarum]